MALATAAFVAGARAARRGAVSDVELRWYRRLNALPREAFVPVWTVMQLGSLGGGLATGAGLAAAGRPALGRKVAATGSLTWLGVKAVKPLVRRGRPAVAVGTSRVLGRQQSGLGYPSGHAAVAAAVATVAVPRLPRRWRAPAWMAALVVGPARIYVGAHLPLDVVGGLVFGLGAGTLSRCLPKLASAVDGAGAPIDTAMSRQAKSHEHGVHGSRLTPRSWRSSWRSWRRE